MRESRYSVETRNARCIAPGVRSVAIAAEDYQLGRDLGQASERICSEAIADFRRKSVRRVVEGSERYILPGDRLTSPKAAKGKDLRGFRMTA